MMFDFASQNVLLIGGGQNIGRAVAIEFARRGADVAVADLNLAAAEETAMLVRRNGRRSVALHVDVSGDESVAACVAEAERALGRIDVLMNNAGILSGGNPEDIPVAAWQKMMDVNFFGMVRANALLLPSMIARGSGYIVNTASFAGLYPFASSRMHYAASKAAIVSMSENLALYLMPQGIRVSCLCPGPVMTTSNQSMEHFSQDYTMRGPGAGLPVRAQAEAARILADGMEAGRIIIPTDEDVWKTLADRAASPDGFIRDKAAEFETGDAGRPKTFSEALRIERAQQGHDTSR